MDFSKLSSLLRIYANSKSATKGKIIHQKILILGLQNNIALCKNLISLYFSCNLYDSAKLVFEKIENPLDVSLWNSIMAGYTKNFMFKEALSLFERLQQYSNLNPDSYTYPNVLKACGGLRLGGYGKIIHTQLIKTGFLYDVFVGSALVSMYSKCCMFGDAEKVFDEMPERDVACWNTVISCYYQDGRPEKALELFGIMRGSGFRPNAVTLTAAISSCARLMALERGKEIHRELVEDGILLDGFLGSALVDMYGKCGCVDIAKEVFEEIPEKSVVTWNSMIAGYSSTGDTKSCIEYFKRMNVEGVRPTITTLSSLLMACSRTAQLQYGKFVHAYLIRNRIDADAIVNLSLIELYFKCGHVSAAQNVFEMVSKTNISLWNVMISGYVGTGDYFNALRLYETMVETGIKPDEITFTSILPACSQLAALEKGKEIHNSIIASNLEDNEVVMGALLDMYAKCGAVDKAIGIFSKLPEKDLVSWTSMITAYGSHGQALEALKLFGDMERSNAKPDGVTFLAVLSTCSHAGLVDEGCYYFNLMTNRYNSKPKIEHYSCLIDLLGRAGRLHDAYQILNRNAETREDVDLLSTLLSACCLHKSLELGEEIGKILMEKDPDNPSTMIVLSNLYASGKKWDEVRKMRLNMKGMNLRKNPGCSWVEIDKNIQPFFAEDKSHPQAEVVYECLMSLSNHMEKDDLKL